MSNKKSIMAQAQRLEDCINDSLHRINTIEKRLLTVENRENLEKELAEVKNILQCNEQKLQQFRKQNTKSYMVSACLVFLCFLFYGLYLMIFESV